MAEDMKFTESEIPELGDKEVLVNVSEHFSLLFPPP
jgi:hypothetical protein